MFNTIKSHPRYRRSVEHMTTLQTYLGRARDFVHQPIKNANVNIKTVIRNFNGHLTSNANKAAVLVKKGLDKYQEALNKIYNKVSTYEYPAYTKAVVQEFVNQVGIKNHSFNLTT